MRRRRGDGRYLRRAVRRGLGWPLPAELDDAALEARLFPRAAPAAGRARPDCAYIHRELKRDGVTLQLLWEEYTQVHPSGYRRTQFFEIYRQWARRLRPSMRQVHRAGEKTFIDFSGKRPSLVDRRTGELRRVELFVAVLGASRPRRPRPSSWLTGSTRISTWWTTSAAPPRPAQERRHPALPLRARGQSHLRGPGRPLRRRRGPGAAAQAPRQSGRRNQCARGPALDTGPAPRPDLLRPRRAERGDPRLLDELNDRPLKKLGVSRRRLYEQIDRPALRPLPAARYVLAHWKLCRVNIDYHVEVERHAYSVPYQLVREQVEVRYTTHTVEIFHRDKRVASHRRRYDRQPSTAVEHMPSAHRAHAEWSPSRLIRWAEKVGPATGKLVSRILESRPHPEQGYRACLGIMRLGRQYGNDRLDAASARAMALGSCRYRTVRNILAAGQDRLPLAPPPETNPTPAHANIRGADYYATTTTGEDRCSSNRRSTSSTP